MVTRANLPCCNCNESALCIWLTVLARQADWLADFEREFGSWEARRAWPPRLRREAIARSRSKEDPEATGRSRNTRCTSDSSFL